MSPSKAAGVCNQFQGAGYGSKTASPSNNSEPLPPDNGFHCLYVDIVHRSKLYTDDTGHFLTRARSRNQYFVVAYHSSNVILVQPFASRKYVHRLNAYNIITQRPKDTDLLVDLQVLNNKCSKEYTKLMRENGE